MSHNVEKWLTRNDSGSKADLVIRSVPDDFSSEDFIELAVLALDQSDLSVPQFFDEDEAVRQMCKKIRAYCRS